MKKLLHKCIPSSKWMSAPISLAILMLFESCLSVQQPSAQQIAEPPGPACLTCPSGGRVFGDGFHGTAEAKWVGSGTICPVAPSIMEDGEIYVRFQLDGKFWPTETFALRADSYRIECDQSPVP